MHYTPVPKDDRTFQFDAYISYYVGVSIYTSIHFSGQVINIWCNKNTRNYGSK